MSFKNFINIYQHQNFIYNNVIQKFYKHISTSKFLKFMINFKNFDVDI